MLVRSLLRSGANETYQLVASRIVDPIPSTAVLNQTLPIIVGEQEEQGAPDSAGPTLTERLMQTFRVNAVRRDRTQEIVRVLGAATEPIFRAAYIVDEDDVHVVGGELGDGYTLVSVQVPEIAFSEQNPIVIRSANQARQVLARIQGSFSRYRFLLNLNPQARARILIRLRWQGQDSQGHISTNYLRNPFDGLAGRLRTLFEDYAKTGLAAIVGVQIDYLVRAPFFAQGGAKALLQAFEHFYICSQRSQFNCLYDSAAVCLEVLETRDVDVLLHPGKTGARSRALKSAVRRLMETRGQPFNERAATVEVLQPLSEVARARVVVYDNLFGKMYTFCGEQHDKTLEIQVREGHAMALIRRSLFSPSQQETLDAVYKQYKNVEMPLIDYLISVEEGNKNPRKVVDRSHTRLMKPKIYEEAQEIRRTGAVPPRARLGTFDVETYGDEFQPYALGFAWELRADENVESLRRLGAKLEMGLLGRNVAHVQFWGLQCYERFMEFLHEFIFLFNGLTIYAHNGGKFDFLMLLDEQFFSTRETAGKRCFELSDVLEQNGCFVFFKLYHKRSGMTLNFRDSLRLLPGTLYNLTKDFRVPHQKLKEIVDHSMVTADNFRSPHIRDNMALYLTHDILGLWEVLASFQDSMRERFSLETTQCMTTASLSKQVFFSQFYDPETHPLYDLTTTEDAFIRESYFGGRCECFYQGEIGRAFYYDFTSLYPHCMRKEVPVGKGRMHAFSSNTHVLPDDFHGFVRCKIRSREVYNAHTQSYGRLKPLHAVKRKVYGSERLCFPWCEDWVTVVLFSEEIRLGQKFAMYDYEMLDGIAFEGFSPILREFAETCFSGKARAKEEGKTALALAYKLIANSGYGFWGLRTQGKTSTKVYPKREKMYAEYLFANELVSFGERGDYTLCRVTTELPVRCIHVGIASAITSWARMELWNAIHAFEQAGAVVYYCDTDSLITNGDLSSPEMLDVARTFSWDGMDAYGGYNAWMAGKELGSLKNEACDKLAKWAAKDDLQQLRESCRNPAFDRGIVALCKLYALQWKDPSCGLWRTAQAAKGISQADFVYYVRGHLVHPDDGTTLATAAADGKFYTEEGDVYLPGLIKLPTGEVCDIYGNVRTDNDLPLRMGKLLYQEYHDLLDGRPILRHNEQWTKPKTDLLREQHQWMFKKQYCPKELRLFRDQDGERVNRYGKGVVEESGRIRPLNIPSEDDRLAEEEPLEPVAHEDELSMQLDTQQLIKPSEFKSRQISLFYQHLPDFALPEISRRLETDHEFLRDVLLDPEGVAVELLEELDDGPDISRNSETASPLCDPWSDQDCDYDTAEDWSDMEERLRHEDHQRPYKKCRFVEEEAEVSD